MRPIDADLLLDVARAMQAEKEETAYNFLNDAQNPSTEWECVEDLIENAPTIEAEPVRYAHWVNDTFCSNCKRFPVDVSVSISNRELTKYFSRCPHCGAKMGGKKE